LKACPACFLGRWWGASLGKGVSRDGCHCYFGCILMYHCFCRQYVHYYCI
jgi:hypothetical protein